MFPWERIKFTYNVFYQTFQLPSAKCFLMDLLNTDIPPFFIKGIRTSRFLLVWPGGIQKPHEQVAQNDGINAFMDQWQSQMKSGVLFQSDRKRNDRNISKPGFGKSTSYESNIVGCTASATRLRDQKSSAGKIIFPGKKRSHHLSNNNGRWITCIVVYILQSDINGFFCIIIQDHKIVTLCLESMLY